MKTRLQHLLHPLNLWCLLGGQVTWIFMLYEKWLWQPLFRRVLNDNPNELRERT